MIIFISVYWFSVWKNTVYDLLDKNKDTIYQKATIHQKDTIHLKATIYPKDTIYQKATIYQKDTNLNHYHLLSVFSKVPDMGGGGFHPHTSGFIAKFHEAEIFLSIFA